MMLLFLPLMVCRYYWFLHIRRTIFGKFSKNLPKNRKPGQSLRILR